MATLVVLTRVTPETLKMMWRGRSEAQAGALALDVGTGTEGAAEDRPVLAHHSPRVNTRLGQRALRRGPHRTPAT